MKIKTLKSIILGIDIKPIGTILEVGPDISETDAQRMIGFGDMVELLPETTTSKPAAAKEKAPPPALKKVFPASKNKKSK